MWIPGGAETGGWCSPPPPPPPPGAGVEGVGLGTGELDAGEESTISPSAVIIVLSGLVSAVADGGASADPEGTGQQTGVLSEARPAWRDMWRRGIGGREWRVRKVLRKRARREGHRVGE